MLRTRLIGAVMAVLFLAGASFAGEECQECPIEQAVSKLPKLTYAVGETATCCAKTAANLAKEHGVEIKYVVADKTYANQQEATLALVEATEKCVKDFASPARCEKSGLITVGGKGHCCETSAGRTAQLISTAMEKVEMKYVVGDKECDCPAEAATLSKEAGKETTFVVAGEKTCCSVTARLNLARAKYRAAVEALTKAEADVKASGKL